MEKLVRMVKFIFTPAPRALLASNRVWLITPTSRHSFKRRFTVLMG